MSPKAIFISYSHVAGPTLPARMKYPWDKNPDGSPRGPIDDLDAAETLINECSYHRRDEEPADAREAAKNW